MSENTNNTEFDQALQEEFGEKLMDHEYDGIKELDNPAPAWIMAIFYLTIAISAFYGAYYFMFDGPSQEEEYMAEVQAHEAILAANKANSAPLALLTDDAALNEGAELYKSMSCAACHGVNGEGNAIGPNLTDNAWLMDDCNFDAVFNVIKNGNPTKGMTAFKGQMSDQQIQRVASFVLQKMQGSSPENAKEPQGNVCQ